MATDWTPELTVNHDLLDRHHVDLFRRLRDAAAAADAGALPALSAAVADFADAFLEHVATEEALMDASLYPERGRHRAAHELFVADVVQVRAELRDRGTTPAVLEWVRSRAPEWLRFHIRTNDAPFGAWLARQGPAIAARVGARDLRRPS